ncbi:protein phosphatase 1 regulatory subunit 12C isoform X30 [Spodoptera frugiperda]|uniref:Protein phosphatase 1 regulatory subunit 12C isoform X30 n=1 Tax=Spodoptera frugiperda TaxID=7108 RepID=A0A9R0F4G7_SPOFR|nr:protein phosphatase 1 regulatory subunit 12C isoform X30 [Spodoptera frugiperda]
MTDNRSSSALFKRAEQLKRWEESDTNKQSPTPRRASRIQFSSGIVFLAACTAGDKDEVQRLLKRGADINTANVDGLTALHQACIDDNLDMVEFLVTHGADVNRGDNEGWTPLHATSSCGFLSIARYLLENGADVAAVNYDGELPVDIAESDEMAELLQKVIDEKGVDCDKSRSAEVDTLLSDARNWAANGYVEVRDMNGGTPLHVAAAKGYIDVATTLLEECSADPDCVDYEGWTPLHAAALWGQKDAAALLLQYGADPLIKNYSGQTCMDLVDPTMTSWLADAMNAQRRMNNNNNKRKRSPPQHDAKRVDIEINSQPEKVVNGKTTDKPPASPEIAKTEGKPPRGRPSSPDTTETESSPEDAPSWRRSASFRNRQPEPPRENSKTVNNAVDNDTILRRTHSFENDKSFYQRYRDVTARIKASSCPSIPPAQPPTERKKPQEHTNNATESTNDDVQTRINPSDRREREVNTWSGPTTTTPSASPTNTTTTTTVRRSFVPPVRDEESETQRKAHAKRVRETRRSTQGVTLDEIKSAEQLVKKKAGNGTTESPSPGSPKKDDPTPTPAPAPTDNGSFELEDAGRSSPRPATTAAEATVTLPYRRPPTGSNANTTTSTPKDDNRTEPSGEEDKERESSTESKSSSNASPASTQAALNVIQRRRRPKRRSTGVGHVDMDDIVNDRGGGGEGCDADNEAPASGSERTEESEDKDYKALYEASQSEVRRLRALLATSEQQLREARGTITRLTQVNQNSLSEIEKREKRAMERKLSEMEEELKYQQTLQAENQRLKDENGALIRVISKLSK